MKVYRYLRETKMIGLGYSVCRNGYEPEICPRIPLVGNQIATLKTQH